VDTMKDESNFTELESNLASKNHALQAIETNIAQLNEEVNLLNMQADTRAKLGLIRSEKERKEEIQKNM